MVNNNKQSQKTGKSQRVLWIVLAAATAVTLIAGLVIYLVLSFGNVGEQTKMANYLRGKYGKEFVVSNVRLEGGGLGVEGDLTGDARPSRDQNIKFEVWKGDHGGYVDEYPGAVWAYQEYKALEPLLSGILGATPMFTVEIHTAYKLDGKISGELTSFETAAGIYKKNISYTLRITSVSTIDDSNKEATAGKVYEIIKLIRPKNVDAVISYSTPTTANREYGISVSNDVIDNVNNPQSLIAYFKEWGVSK